MQGNATVRRTVTNVGGTSRHLHRHRIGAGLHRVVSPSTLTPGAGATGSFTVKLTRTDAPTDVWQFGA